MRFFGFGKKKDPSHQDASLAESGQEAKVEEKKVDLPAGEVGAPKASTIESKSKKSEIKEVKPKAEPKEEQKKAPKKGTSVQAKDSATNLTGILIKPRITEKATILVEENNVYTFDIHPRATKNEVSQAIESHYKVKPVKVNITEVKSKRVFRRGKKGKKSGGKKAMVYLRKGDKIEVV